jgi:CubicO group peptidase (beta-lactamase class C family)
MRDTGFTVVASKADRCAGLYGFDDAGRLTPRPFPARTAQMSYISGGQGLWSTLDDYLAFARMFLGKGTVDGVRILKPETHALMTSNRLTAHQRATSELWGLPFFVAGHGFGMGLAVVMEPDKAAPQICGGGIGSVGWPGGFGGWWQADPGDASVLIFLAHNRVDLDQLEKGVGFGVHRAISKFHALATGATA